MRRRQNFTRAHELGHILLHGQFDLNSPSDMTLIDERTAAIMEREANMFASRLLMPTYIFRKVSLTCFQT
ncbi:ImmA/IrrE family metallo-endopeptidase [Cohnella panacarvi]|uniref:ImmA/IrrE family metallo-endopeptidase n=1 Tax=Cohnella panacarvi TaxID=400776 RepID=UPI0012EBE85E